MPDGTIFVRYMNKTFKATGDIELKNGFKLQVVGQIPIYGWIISWNYGFRGLMMAKYCP